MNLTEFLESIYRNSLVDRAKEFATKKHQGQKRQGGADYVIHPTRVADFVKQNKYSKRKPELMAAAFLHDTLEDTSTTIEELRENFGDLVASLVGELTSDKAEILKQGKAKYLISKMKGMSNYALVLKLADRLDNVSDLHLANEKFRIKYSNETKQILNALSQDRKLTYSQLRIINKIRKKLYKLEHETK